MTKNSQKLQKLEIQKFETTLGKTKQLTPVIKKNDKIAICRVCRKVLSNFQFGIRDTPFKDIQEVGIKCPNCDEWYHSYFANPELKAIADKVPTMKRREKRQYQVWFNKLQKNIRREMGMRKVNKSWVYNDTT